MAGYQRYPRDLDWLEGVAANHRTLVLSGDRRSGTGQEEGEQFEFHAASVAGSGKPVVSGGSNDCKKVVRAGSERGLMFTELEAP